jgi:histidinol phosphatase-like enzyme (inositol monophosphatase family)
MKEILEFAVAAAREAGRSTLPLFRSSDLEVETKSNLSPVTRADREAETILRRRISAACPEDGILGEEFGEQEGSSGRRWILDPIDGTISFLRGVPLYGTLVALEEEGRAILGVACFPALGEVVYAARDEGAWWATDGVGGETLRRASVSDVDRLDAAMFCSTSRGAFARHELLDLYARLCEGSGRDRGWGDCYGHALVATGRADVMVDPRLEIWDSAALQPIVEEAGGAFFDLQGNTTHCGGSAVSVNGALAAEVRALLPLA